MDKESLRKLIENELTDYGISEEDAAELADSITELADENGLVFEYERNENYDDQ